MPESTTTSNKNNDNAFGKIFEDLKRKREALKDSPTETRTITNEDDCPRTEFDRCSYCQDVNGQWGISQMFPKPLRIYYNGSECLRSRRAKRLLADCGLVRSNDPRRDEFLHTFANWKRTEANSALFTRMSEWQLSPRGIYLRGNNGVGKTYALHALCLRLCEEGIRARFLRAVDLPTKISVAMNGDGDIEQAVTPYLFADVLFFDDFAKKVARTDWEPEWIYRIVDERDRRGTPIIYSANDSLDAIEEKLGASYGPAVASRIAGNCDLVTLKGDDQRIGGR